MKKRPSLWQWFMAVAVFKVSLFQLRGCLRLIDRHGLEVSFDTLVSHHMAGGRISSWIEGLVYARERGIELEVLNGAARDLVGAGGSRITLIEHIRAAEHAGIRDMRRFPFDTLQKKNA